MIRRTCYLIESLGLDGCFVSAILTTMLLLGVRPGVAHEPESPKRVVEEESGRATTTHVHSSGQDRQKAPSPTQPEPDPTAHDHGGMTVSGINMEGMEHDHGATAASTGGSHDHLPTPPAAGLVWGLLMGSLAIAAGLLLSARKSMRTGVPQNRTPARNLLELPVLGRVLRSRHFITVLLAPTLLIFALIVLVGLGGQQDTGNPAVLLTWILWWPAVIFTFFLVGRIWCAICPFGYMGDLAQRIFSLRWKVPRILRNMWWRLGLFLCLTWATSLWALDRWPSGTAWLALGLTMGAITLAVIFEKRTFCRYVCPVGGVFGLYSMTAPTHLGVKDKRICQEECSTKDCYQSCAWFQFPAVMERNAECSLCLDCVRACPHDNLALCTQPPATDLTLFQPRSKSLDEASAIAAVLGVALLQTVVMLNAWNGWETKVGSWLHLAPGRLLYTIIYVGFGLLLPLLLLAVVSFWSLRQGTNRGDLLHAFRTYAYGFLPLGLALHAAHNFHHLFGEGGAMWLGLRKAVAGYTGWAGLAPAPGDVAFAVAPNVLFTMQWMALMGGLYLACRVSVALLRRNDWPPARLFRAALPLLLFATAYTVLNLFVLSAAMSHRH